mmetsp:Transcript_26606/g.71411  ORF Transcript_26606/g.71411 Transcript_26606/m.71411 type:complete len:285 (+) Transcript_26606:609-1463(+)
MPHSPSPLMSCPRVQAWRTYAALSKAKSTPSSADNQITDVRAAEPAAPLAETSAPSTPDRTASEPIAADEEASPPSLPSPPPPSTPSPSPVAIEVEAETDVDPTHRIPSPSPRGVEAIGESDEAFEEGAKAMTKTNLFALPPPALKFDGLNSDSPEDADVQPAASALPAPSAASKFTLRCVFVWLVIPLLAAVLATLANPGMISLVRVDVETLVRVPGPLESAWENTMSGRSLGTRSAKASGAPARTPPASHAAQQPAKAKFEASEAASKANGGWRRKKAAVGM